MAPTFANTRPILLEHRKRKAPSKPLGSGSQSKRITSFSTSSPASYFRLPRELRDQIYEEILTDTVDFIGVKYKGLTFKITCGKPEFKNEYRMHRPSISKLPWLLTSRQILVEASQAIQRKAHWFLGPYKGALEEFNLDARSSVPWLTPLDARSLDLGCYFTPSPQESNRTHWALLDDSSSILRHFGAGSDMNSRLKRLMLEFNPIFFGSFINSPGLFSIGLSRLAALVYNTELRILEIRFELCFKVEDTQFRYRDEVMHSVKELFFLEIEKVAGKMMKRNRDVEVQQELVREFSRYQLGTHRVLRI